MVMRRGQAEGEWEASNDEKEVLGDDGDTFASWKWIQAWVVVDGGQADSEEGSSPHCIRTPTLSFQLGRILSVSTLTGSPIPKQPSMDILHGCTSFRIGYCQDYCLRQGQSYGVAGTQFLKRADRCRCLQRQSIVAGRSVKVALPPLPAVREAEGPKAGLGILTNNIHHCFEVAPCQANHFARLWATPLGQQAILVIIRRSPWFNTSLLL
ncbi:hypothetical protein B0O80DRAFT_431568 [Mortierella sp. GBAus27b]|nr:hypothetical protein B0O80DRAFT_431568 [Mortierella sp. GBAus27b]